MSIEILKTMLGRRLVAVRRQIFTDDMFLEDYEQQADGPVEFTLSDNVILHFVAEDMLMSIGVVSGPMPRYGESYKLMELSNSSYWSDRVGKKVTKIDVFSSDFRKSGWPCEFIKVSFENGMYTKIIYLDSDELQFDAIKISDKKEMYKILCTMVAE